LRDLSSLLDVGDNYGMTINNLGTVTGVSDTDTKLSTSLYMEPNSGYAGYWDYE